MQRIINELVFQQVIKTIHDKLAVHVRRKIKNEIYHSSVTLDDWTSLQTEIYTAVTCHYISPDWKSKSIVLACINTKGFLFAFSF